MKKGRIIFGIIMIIGIPLFITFLLRKSSNSNGGDHAIFYQTNGKTAIALITKEFKAHSVDRGITYGSSSQYAQAQNVEDGAILWKTELFSDKFSFKEKILGQSDNFLYLINGELFILDKNNGNIVARCKDLEKINPRMKSLFPTFSDKYCMIQNTLFFEGNDGIVYEIKEQNRNFEISKSQKITAKDIDAIERESRNSNYQYRCVFSLSDNKWIALIAPSEESGLDTFRNIKMSSLLTSTSYRMLYEIKYFPLEQNALILKQTNEKEHFMWGEFLTVKNEKCSKNNESEYLIKMLDDAIIESDTLDKFNIKRNKEWVEDTYQKAEALKVGSGYLVTHRADAEKKSEILLSCVTMNGEIIWTKHLGLSEIIEKEKQDDKIILAGRSIDSKNSGITEILTIDLKNLKVNRQEVFPALFTTLPKPTINFNSTNWFSIIVSILNIIFVITIIYYILRMIIKPWRTKMKYDKLKRQGHQLVGKIIKSKTGTITKIGYPQTKITVEFKNFAGSIVTHDFDLFDSKPMENRFALGKDVTLLVLDQSSEIFLAESELKYNFNILAVLGMLTLLSLLLYLPYIDAQGNLLNIGTLGSGLTIIMIISIVIFFLVKKYSKTTLSSNDTKF